MSGLKLKVATATDAPPEAEGLAGPERNRQAELSICCRSHSRSGIGDGWRPPIEAAKRR